MAAIETPRRKRLTTDEVRALEVRHQAAMRIVDSLGSREERLDLLIAVVWPSNPLLGLPSTTSSAIEPS